MNNKINLLIIGYNEWCLNLEKKFKNQQLYHIEFIFNYQDALQRLRHNSYDILLLQQQYFNYNSIQLSQLSYAMSRPSVILCTSYLKLFIYKIWRRYSNWTNKYKISKKLIHIKLINDQNLTQYVTGLVNQIHMIKQVSTQIRSKRKEKSLSV